MLHHEPFVHSIQPLHDMTEAPQAKEKKTRRSKLGSTVLVFLVPILLLAILGLLIGGGSGIGSVEITLLLVIWAVGLAWVWMPRRA